jgi:serine/threonine-protein kinase
VELDDLKAAWTELNQRVGAIESVVRADYRARRLDPIRRALRLMGAWQAIHAVVWVVIVAVIARFWIAHRDVPHLLGAGLLLHAYGVLVICVSVVQLLVIGRTYYTAPIVECQKRVAELYRLRVICGLAVGLPWWVLWVVFLVVGAQALLGVDLYARAPGWIQATVAFGVAALAVSAWLARRLGDRPVLPRWVQSVADDLAGRSLRRAATRLAEIRAFEGKEPVGR